MRAIIVIGMLALFSLPAYSANPTESTENRPAEKITLVQYLYRMGHKLGYYFTVEEVHSSDGSSVLGDSMPDDESATDLKSVVDTLNEHLSDHIAIKDEVNDHIVHIISKTLFHNNIYVGNQNVTMSYRGLLQGVVDRISILTHTDFSNNQFSDGSIIREDPYTKISFDVKSSSVRSVLSDHIPLANYNRVLWVSDTTSSASGRLTTLISFYGPMRPNQLQTF